MKSLRSYMHICAITLIAFAMAFATVFPDCAAQGADESTYALRRTQMLADIERHARISGSSTGAHSIDSEILAAMGAVPRHLFVPDSLRELAYLDTPLPIGQGQNIAQPYLVALMTQLARIEPGDTVFETGTGAGYHAAVLSLLAKRVVSVEVVAPLALRASIKLEDLEYHNVEVIAADGYYGAPGKGPFDAMIVKESLDHVPSPLMSQLKPGGRLVLPLGPRAGPQFLTVIEKREDGSVRTTRILPVNFSPLQGGQRI